MWWTEGGGGDGMVYPKLNLHNNDKVCAVPLPLRAADSFLSF